MVEDTKALRDKLRAQVMAKSGASRQKLTFKGIVVEVKQPTIGYINKIAHAEGINLANMMIDLIYLPGTNVHLFDEADHEVLTEMPFDTDAQAFQRLVNEMTGIDIKEGLEQVREDPSGAASTKSH